jgi:hypothetical protein
MLNITRLITFVMLLATIALVTLAKTSFVQRWKTTEGPAPTLHKLLVWSLTDNYIIRQHFEDEMEIQLQKAGAEGIKSHMVMPPANETSEDEIIQRIRESPLDSVMVVRPIDKRQVHEDTAEMVVAYTPMPYYYSFAPYWHYAYQTTYTPGYTKESTIVQVETNIYSTKNEKLLWSGVSDTILKEELDKNAKSLAKALVKQLKKDHFLPKN